MKNMSTGALIAIVLVTFIVFNGLLAGLLILNSMNAPEPRQYTDVEIRAAFALATSEPTATPTPTTAPTPVPTPAPLSLEQLVARDSVAAIPADPKLLKVKPSAFVSAFNKAAKKLENAYLLENPEQLDERFTLYSLSSDIALMICSVDSKLYQVSLLCVGEDEFSVESPAYICADSMMAALNSKLSVDERAALLDSLRITELPINQEIVQSDIATGGIRYEYSRSHIDGVRFVAHYNTQETN